MIELLVGIILGAVGCHVLSCPTRRQHLINAFKSNKPKIDHADNPNQS